MTLHVCDFCKKEIQKGQNKYMVPVKEKMKCVKEGEILGIFSTGKFLTKEVELCESCSTILSDLIEIMIENTDKNS